MKAKVISNSCIKGDYHKLVLKPSQSIVAKPGQFLMLSPGTFRNYSDPLLPRPFSVHRVTINGNLEILYKVVGKGTTLLAHTCTEESIELLGPLGNGFSIDGVHEADMVLIVAGGIGVAPMPAFAETLRTTYPQKKIMVFLGGRGDVDLLCVEELKRVASEVILATQDGSSGLQGYVTDALEEYLKREYHSRQEQPAQTGAAKNGPDRREAYRVSMLYSCGPNPMLQRVSEIARPLNIDTYFSLEATMGCGIGICMGCAVKMKEGGYCLVCKDGPVFRGDRIDLSDET